MKRAHQVIKNEVFGTSGGLWGTRSFQERALGAAIQTVVLVWVPLSRFSAQFWIPLDSEGCPIIMCFFKNTHKMRNVDVSAHIDFAFKRPLFS